MVGGGKIDTTTEEKEGRPSLYFLGSTVGAVLTFPVVVQGLAGSLDPPWGGVKVWQSQGRGFLKMDAWYWDYKNKMQIILIHILKLSILWTV